MQDGSLKRGERLNGMVALNVRLSVGSLARGRSCGRLHAVAIDGRLARYLVRFLFFTRRTLRSCELVALWSVARRRTPVLRTNRPVVGHSAANTGPANHQSYGRMFAKFASRLMTRSARTPFGSRQRRVSVGIHRPTESECWFLPFYSQKVGQLGHVF